MKFGLGYCIWALTNNNNNKEKKRKKKKKKKFEGCSSRRPSEKPSRARGRCTRALRHNRCTKIIDVPVNMPDLIRKRFGYGQLRPLRPVTASYGHYGRRTARIVPDRMCWIRLPASFSVPFFRRRHGPYCAKPTRVPSGWPAWSVRVWLNSSGLKASWCPVFGRIFPIFRPVAFFHRRSG